MSDPHQSGDGRVVETSHDAPDELGEPRDEALEALWGRVLAEWNEPKTHAALLEYALMAQRLPQIAALYRELKDDPEKGEVAAKRLEGVAIAATHLLMSTASPRTKTTAPAVITVIAAILAFAALTWLARAVLSLRP